MFLQTATHTIRNFFSGLLHLVYPETCTVCGESLRHGERLMCTTCLFDLPQIHIHSGEQNPLIQLLAGQVYFVRASSFFYYSRENSYSDIIHDIKYRGKTQHGEMIGEMFADSLQKQNFFDSIDAIVPIPLHNKRLRERTYNQSEVIARGISRVANLPIISDAIQRNVYTRTQTNKSKEQRKLNVDNVFEISNLQKLQGKHILLFDDVITTGATVLSCAQCIQQAVPNCTISIASIGLA